MNVQWQVTLYQLEIRPVRLLPVLGSYLAC